MNSRGSARSAQPSACLLLSSHRSRPRTRSWLYPTPPPVPPARSPSRSLSNSATGKGRASSRNSTPLMRWARVVRSGDGDYYVPAHLGDGQLLRFSSDGVLQEAIGRRGEGPGEYDLPLLMGGSADDLTILDPVSSRLTTIRSGEVATWRLPFRSGGFAVLRDGRHVYNAFSSESDRMGHPLHVYDAASRRITSSFGDEGARGPRMDSGLPALRRRVAAASDGNIWAARGNRYRIDNGAPTASASCESSAMHPGFGPGTNGPAWTTR